MSADAIWINPLGGLGDALMLSGVLKRAYEQGQTYHLIRRTKYLGILSDHPAIDYVGYPPKDAAIIQTDYWTDEEYGTLRAFQILAGRFGLLLPSDETLYMPGIPEHVALFDDIPFGNWNVVIAPASDSPRKEMAPGHWEELVARLQDNGAFVLQVGTLRQLPIRGAYSLLGLTTPRELVALLGRCDRVVTPDNFVMHAAHLAGKTAVVLWGPTQERVYGYPGHIPLRASPLCERQAACIGPKNNAYPRPCERGEKAHCMNRITVETIFKNCRRRI